VSRGDIPCHGSVAAQAARARRADMIDKRIMISLIRLLFNVIQ
jgi:hypothetical protein